MSTFNVLTLVPIKDKTKKVWIDEFLNVFKHIGWSRQGTKVFNEKLKLRVTVKFPTHPALTFIEVISYKESLSRASLIIITYSDVVSGKSTITIDDEQMIMRFVKKIDDEDSYSLNHELSIDLE